MMKVKFSLAFMMGDCKGNDHLAGKYGSHGQMVKRISRACDCPSEKADNPKYECTFTLQSDVVEILSNPDTKERLNQLKQISQHDLKNAFYKVSFGGDPHNIHGCSPVDAILHALIEGMYRYSMKIFFAFCGASFCAELDELVIQFALQG